MVGNTAVGELLEGKDKLGQQTASRSANSGLRDGPQARFDHDARRSAVVQRQAPATVAVPGSVIAGQKAISADLTTFSSAMADASTTIADTEKYLEGINTTYGGAYSTYKSTLGNAAQEAEDNTALLLILLAVAAIAIANPEAAAAIGGPLLKAKDFIDAKPITDLVENPAWKLLIKNSAKVAQGAVTSALAGGAPASNSGGAPSSAQDIQIVSLQNIVDLLERKNDLSDAGMQFYAAAMSALTSRAAWPGPLEPPSAEDTDRDVAALQNASKGFLAAIDPPMTALRSLHDKVNALAGAPPPSQNDVEKDIWIAHMSINGVITTCSKKANLDRITAIGLAGDMNLDVEEHWFGLLGWTADATLPGTPGGEDEKNQQSVEPTPPKVVDANTVVKALAGQLPQKWNKILLMD